MDITQNKSKKETHTKQVRFYLTPEMHLKMRRICADLDCKIQDAAELAVVALIESHKKELPKGD